MGKLMISSAMTIDGVIEVGDWYVGEGEHSRAAFDMPGSVDAGVTLLATSRCRRAQADRRQHDVARRLLHGLRGDVEEILALGSRTLWSDLLANGLVDELHLPVDGRIVGGRTPMFEAAPPASLRLLEKRTWDGSDNVLLRYAARRGSGSPSD